MVFEGARNFHFKGKVYRLLWLILIMMRFYLEVVRFNGISIAEGVIIKN